MSKILFFPKVYIFIISILHEIHLQPVYGNKCDEEFFYKPYVTVKKKKNGGDIASLRSSGFLDLRFRNRVLLCINGPVVLYSDVERLDPDMTQPKQDKSKNSLGNSPDARNQNPNHHGSTSNDGTGDEELHFKKGDLAVFNHQCISINKIPHNFLKKMKEDQGRSNPEILPETQVLGRLVLGVFLIGDKESYAKPTLAWFKGIENDYVKTRDKTVKDSSFAIINTPTSQSHCLRLPDGTNVKISGPKNRNGTLEVCKWTVSEKEKAWYAQVFQRGYDSNGISTGEETLQEGDYDFFECPDSNPDQDIILSMSRTTPSPIGQNNYSEFDPFSLFNPNLWTPHGFRRDSDGRSGGDERQEDRAVVANGMSDDVPCSLDPGNPDCMDGDVEMEMTMLRDMQNVDPTALNTHEIIAEHCLPLPLFDNACECGGGNNSKRLLELILELPPEIKPPETEPTCAPPKASAEVPEGPICAEKKKGLPDWGNLDSNEHLKWKLDILYLVADIFSHLCMPFRPDFAYTVARVFGWYVLRAHVYGESMGRFDPTSSSSGSPAEPPPTASQFDDFIVQSDTWIILEKELERCATTAKNENGGKGLKFQWEVGDETSKSTNQAKDGKSTKRRKRSIDQIEYHNPIFTRRKTAYSEEYFDKAIISRRKRSTSPYKSPGINWRYLLPGKSLTAIKSEGAVGYAREVIQEYRPVPDWSDPRADAAKYYEFPENIQHCWHPKLDTESKQIVCTKTEDIFFYEDKAELSYELNIAIDLWWKIWAAAIGYCNKAYNSRKSETFPRLYNGKFEYFFRLVMKEWRCPQDNEDLKIILSEFLTEESQLWLDACVEASYINSNSHSFRPPRPMSVEENSTKVSNYFEEVPSYLYYRYHRDPSVTL